MPASEIHIDKFKLKSNASFTLREGWLTKGLRHVSEDPETFLTDSAIETLGVGSAMVKSMRHWMLASGLATEPKAGRRKQELTPLGKLILENDLYFENYFTLFIVHYHIVTNKELATVWYLLFNHYNASRFSKDNMTEALLAQFREMTTKDFSESSFKDDCAAALKSYVSDATKQSSPEDNMQCPLVALGLFTKTARSTYEVTIPTAANLHAQAVLYVLLDRMQERESISLEKLLNEPCNVGKVFHLNAYRLNAYLDELQAEGVLEIQRTAGLNMVYPKTNLTAIDVAAKYYGR